MENTNIIEHIGDFFIIRPKFNLLGVKLLFDFVDDVRGETQDRFFIRKFRYILKFSEEDYSDWFEISQSNFQKVRYDEDDIFDFEIKYQRAGTDDSGYLIFNGFSLKILREEFKNIIPYSESFLQNILKIDGFFALDWHANVLRKICEKGIVPDFIERTQDYRNFFSAFTHWFSILVNYARNVVQIENHRDLFEEFLKQKDLIFEQGLSIEELLEIHDFLIEAFRLRGVSIIDNNEIRRLLGEKPFIESFLEEKKRGFCVGRSSPLYKGVIGSSNSILGWEKDPGITNIDLYPFIQGILDNSTVTDNELTVTTSGFGTTQYFSHFYPKNRIKIDPKISYLIQFSFSNYDESGSGSSITFTVKAYNSLGHNVNVNSIQQGSANNKFIDSYKFPQSTRVDLLGVLYGYDKEKLLVEDSINNVGSPGNNLQLPIAADSIGFELFTNKATSSISHFKIYEFKIIPLMVNRPLGFVSLVNPILIWANNRNLNLNKNKILKIIYEKFTPYGATILPIWTNEEIEDEIHPLIIASIIHKNISCYDLDDGEIVINAIGGTPPYQYSVDGSYQSGNTFSFLEEGSYTPMVLDSNNVSVSGKEIVIVRPDKIEILGIMIINVSMYGLADGSILINASGGTNPLSYSIKKDSGSWSPWKTSNLFNLLSAGTYTVRVSDANECSPIYSSVITVTQPSQLKFDSVTKKDITCYHLNDGEIQVTLKDGVSPYQFRLNSGAWKNIGIFSSLSNGSYIVRAKDSTGYQISYPSISIVRPPKLTILDIIIEDVSYYEGDDGKITVIATGGTGSKQYSIKAADSQIWGPWTSSNVFEDLESDEYNIRVKDENNCQTVFPEEVLVDQPAEPTTTLKPITTTQVPSRNIVLVFHGSHAVEGQNYWVSGGTYLGNKTWQVPAGGTVTLRATDKTSPPVEYFQRWEIPSIGTVYSKSYQYQVPSGSSNINIHVHFTEIG